ncbi:MAG: hypothetical protein PUD03_03450 [Lachnospiraceae bacterium]|nr:hypothetical protein [Lachnospiraceae bacterium]
MLKKAASKISNLILPVGVFVFLGIYAFLFILRIPNDTKLTGVTLTEYPEETEPSAIMNGSFQNALGNYITEHFYGYQASVINHNQIQYSVFRDGAGVYSQGREGYVFDTEQSLDYLRGERNQIDYAAYDDYALKVSIMQMQLEGLGKEFIYILDPIKAEVFSDKLPWRLRILEEHYAGEGNLKMRAMVDAFEKYGVNYYVTTDDLKEMRKQDEYPVFCKTGHHWTLTAAANELSTMFEKLNVDGTYQTLPDICVTGIKEEEYEWDQDIIQILNVKKYRASKSTCPVIQYEAPEHNAFMFGTSFGCEIADTLYRSPDNRAFDQFTFMHYFTSRMTYNENGADVIKYTQDTDINEMDILDRVSESRLVIMEQQAGILETHQKFVDYLNENMINGNVGGIK